MKRGLSFLLALALCLSLCPVSALALDLGGAAAVGSEAAEETPVIEAPAAEAPVAEEAAEEAAEESAEEAAADGATSGSCGTNATWTLSGGTLTISGSGNMTNYPLFDHPWETFNENITKIVINSGITSIGDSAFSYLIKVTSVSIPSTVTRIGDYAFQGMEELKTISLPAGLKSIGGQAFLGCISLEKVVIPENTELGSVSFSGCQGLKTAGPVGGGYNLEFYWTESIPENAFSGCSSLISIEIPDTIKTIEESAFQECRGLSSITIPDSVTDIRDSAFFGCSNLTSINLPSGLTEISSGVFWYCSNLTTIQIPYGVQSIDWLAFAYCSNLESIFLPATITSIDSDAFDDCVYLSDVYYGGTESQWNEIKFGWGSQGMGEELANATIHFNAAKLPAPEISISAVASSGKPRLTWDAVEGAVKYEVWRSTSKNGTYYKQGSTTSTSYTNTGAVAGKTYYYKVRAISSAAMFNSDYSTVKNMTCDYARPVVSISCNATTGKPKLTWEAVDGATKYEIWRATSKNGTYSKIYTTSNCYFNNSKAEANKSYYYKVRAIGSSSYATSAYSSMVSITCDCARPVVSISCKASTGKPVLTWSAVDGAVKYEVWRAYSKNGTYYKMGTTSGTTYTNTGAKANTTYYYKVYAIGSSSYAKSAASTVDYITCDCAQPQISVAIRSDGKPRLTWEAVDGAVKYEVWRSGYRNGTYTKLGTTTGTSYSNTGAKAGYTYFYKVRAIGSSSYATSAFSTILSAKCK